LITISVLHSLSVHDTATTEIYTLSLHDAIPFTVLVSFTLNILLRELGAADLSGAGAAFGAATQVGPMVTVLIVAGAGATAMCADLGSRPIRDEFDALEAPGINPRSAEHT